MNFKLVSLYCPQNKTKKEPYGSYVLNGTPMVTILELHQKIYNIANKYFDTH